MRAEDGAGADTLADNLADRGRQSWVNDAGVRWTRTAFEGSGRTVREDSKAPAPGCWR